MLALAPENPCGAFTRPAFNLAVPKQLGLERGERVVPFIHREVLLDHVRARGPKRAASPVVGLALAVLAGADLGGLPLLGLALAAEELDALADHVEAGALAAAL